MKDMNRRDFLSLVGVGVASAVLPGSCREKQYGSRPNVVVILIDTLRPDYLGFYGYKKETATFLAKMAKNSLVFTRAFSTSSWTAPSTASLFTSRYPHQHGVIEGFGAHKRLVEEFKRMGRAVMSLNRLPAKMPTMPEIFKSMGYTTFGIATNINIGNEIGFSQGFDQFERINYRRAPAPVLYEWIKEREEKIKNARPFFLYLHPNDVHGPYHKRQPYYTKQIDPQEESRARYISEIGYVDAYISKIYKMLNLADNTIIAVISDHGEEFWEHGGTGHKAKLYRELTNVLMILHAPFLEPKPRYINVNVSLIDILPTLLELVNGNPLQAAEGVSLAPLLRPSISAMKLTEELRDRTLFAHRIEDVTTSPERHWSENNPELQHWAAIYRHWNLIERWDRKELFDHQRDWMEKYNIFSEHPKVASQLLAALQKFKKQGQSKSKEKASVNLDEDLVETLRSLGYVK